MISTRTKTYPATAIIAIQASRDRCRDWKSFYITGVYVKEHLDRDQRRDRPPGCAGLAVNNGIPLIGFALRAQQRGKGLREALLQAVELRTRPIFMIAGAAAVGMLPVAMEWSSRSSGFRRWRSPQLPA